MKKSHQATLKEKTNNNSNSNPKVSETTFSKFILVDLAGSEKGGLHQVKSMKSIEGSNINKSLLALGSCINGLVEAYTKGLSKAFIPWRDSKLTRILKVF